MLPMPLISRAPLAQSGNRRDVSVDFLHACVFAVRTRSVLTGKFSGENEMSSVRERYDEAFWRAHHEAWVQSELNQRECCEAYGVPLKAFGNWRAKFKAEPQTPATQGALPARRA